MKIPVGDPVEDPVEDPIEYTDEDPQESEDIPELEIEHKDDNTPTFDIKTEPQDDPPHVDPPVKQKS